MNDFFIQYKYFVVADFEEELLQSGLDEVETKKISLYLTKAMQGVESFLKEAQGTEVDIC